jgi:hypothetical protein
VPRFDLHKQVGSWKVSAVGETSFTSHSHSVAARDAAAKSQQATLLATLLGHADARLLLSRRPHVVKCTPSALRATWSTLRRIADHDEDNVRAIIRKHPDLITLRSTDIQVSWITAPHFWCSERLQMRL